MTTSFYNGISGLKSFQSGIDIWGDNIANVNTPGFKESIPEFSTIFSSTLNSNSSPTSDIGLGSYLSSSAKDMGIGSLIQTDNVFDLAIGNEGWFGVKNKDQTFYTRNGNFKRDMEGFLVNDNGEYLLVANANNLINKNGSYYIDTTVNTDNLMKTDEFKPISLPDNVTIPATPTKNVSLTASLNNEDKIYKLNPAQSDIDLSALYDKDGNAINMSNQQSLVFGFGNQVDYNDGLLTSTFCFNDDIQDGKDVDIDFNINNTNIKLTLPDKSTKEEIASKIASELQKNGIDATAENGELTINTQNEFILTSNTPLLQNTAAAKLVYSQEPQNPYEFSNLEEFKNKIQTLANTVSNDLNVNYENGEISIANNSDSIVNIYTTKTENTNDSFLTNLNIMKGLQIFPQKSFKTFTFNQNTQEFGGNVILPDGKYPITFSFTKEKVVANQTVWRGEITIQTDPPKTLSDEFVFNSMGMLLSPRKLNFNDMVLNFDLLTYTTPDSNAINYSFSQDGVEEGYLKNYEIDSEGKIIGVFSNSKQITLGQIPIFHFQNDQGLANIGGNDFIPTSDSGDAFLYTDENGNYIPSKILSSTLESSNVDFTQAMTELIVTQKAFQASAKTVTTSDEMIQKAINLKR